MRVEEIEHWVIDLLANPKNSASIQSLMKTKDIEIQSLKKNINIPGIDHVQTLKLQEMQQEKD